MGHPLTVPVAATAVRRRWVELPEQVRRETEHRLGSAVVEAHSQGSGFTPGMASRLRLADGRRVFVKAADDATQPVFSASYREERRKVAALPAQVPAPALLWSYDADGWVVLCFEDVAGRPPHRPWRVDELALTVEAVTAMAGALTPAPDGLALPTWEQELASIPGYWDRARPGDVFGPRASEALDLAHRGLRAGNGRTMVHCDLRDDNVIIGAQRVWFCDWNWPVRGAPWIDLLTLLISARGDGHDADAVLRDNPLTAEVDPESIDAVLALLTGYFLGVATEEVPITSPWIRLHQQWYADVLTEWLAARCGWT